MSDFYGKLAKDALEDDVSDVSDGELQEMLANMDDLDAGLFGTKLKIVSKSPSPPLPEEHVSFQTTHSGVPTGVISAAVTIPKSKKSELLAELFGSDIEEVLPQKPSSTVAIINQEIKSDLKQPKPASTIPKSTEREAEKSQQSPISYVPTPGVRGGRRNTEKTKAKEILWDEFLQPEKFLELPKEEASFDSSQAPVEPVSLTIRTDDEVLPRVGRRATDAIQLPKQIKQNTTSIKFELTDEMKEQISAMITGRQQKLSEELDSRFNEECTTLKQQNVELKERITMLEELVASQKENIKELNKALETAGISFAQQMEANLEQFQINLQEQNLKQKENWSTANCQLSQLEERVQDLQQFTDSILPVQLSLKEKLSALQANFGESHDQLTTLISNVRDLTLEEEKKLRKQLEDKIFKVSSQIGNWEILERKQDIFEERMNKMISSISSNRNEEEFMERLDRSESSILQKLNYCNNQQVRHENWHQQQLSNIAENLEQRLWGVQMHMDMVVANLKSEVSTVRSEMSNRLGDMENKVICAENETSRLGRLAERLCALLQLWEARNRESNKIQLVAEQSLKERFTLAMAELNHDGK